MEKTEGANLEKRKWNIGWMEKIKRKESAEKKRTEVIGVVGCGFGTGTTHFSILAANYLTGVLKRRTAVLEWNDSGDFERIEKVCTKKEVLKNTGNTFKILEVSYLKKAGKEALSECMNQGYETIIIDFGNDLEQAREEFRCCDRKFLLGALCEWRLEAFAELILRKKREDGRWELLCAFGSPEAEKEFKRRLHVFLRRIPDLPDAFTVTGEAIAFFEGFLK